MKINIHPSSITSLQELSQEQHRYSLLNHFRHHWKKLAFSLSTLTSATLGAGSATWNLNANGNWNVNANWNPATGFPNGIDQTATLGSVITAPRTIPLGQNITIGSLSIDNSNAYTVGVGVVNNLTFDVSAGSAALTVTNVNGNGAHTIASPLVLNDALILTQNSTGTLTISGAISGANNLTKSGTGAVTFSGNAVANTYSGTTTITSGTLRLAKTAGTNAIAGNVLISGGTLQLVAANQIADTSSITINGGTFQMSSNSETIQSLTFTKGSLFIGAGGTLTLLPGAGNTALTINNGLISAPGTVLISGPGSTSAADGIGPGDVVFSPTNNNSTATISSALNLGGLTRTFNVGGSFSAPGSIRIAGNTTNGGIIKTGVGALILAGTNTLTNGITVNAGGVGVLGTTTVSPSQLILNSGGFLKGTGTVNGDVVVNNGAFILPGNPPLNPTGTLIINGNLTLSPASTLTYSGFPDLSTPLPSIVVSGTAQLAGTLFVNTTPGFLPLGATYTIISAGTVSGTFDLQEFTGFNNFGVIYGPTSVQLLVTGNLDVCALKGQLAVYANYLNNFLSIDQFLAQLSRLSPTELDAAINSIFPRSAATFSSLSPSVCQITNNMKGNLRENPSSGTAFLARSLEKPRSGYLDERHLLAGLDLLGYENPQKKSSQGDNYDVELLSAEETPHANWSVWSSGFSLWAHQGAIKTNPAFSYFSYGASLGCDYFGFKNCGIGGGLLYIHTDLTESQDLGTQTLDYAHGLFYSSFPIKAFTLNLGISGGWHNTLNKRNIVYPGFSATAVSDFDGYQVIPHIDMNYDFSFGTWSISPLIQEDWAVDLERPWTEHRAAPYNFKQSSQLSSVLRSEAGLNFFETWDLKNKGLFVFREKVSYVNVAPFQHKKVTAQLAEVASPSQINVNTRMSSFTILCSSTANAAFEVDIPTALQNLADIAAEIRYQSTSSFNALLTFEGQYGKGYRSNALFLTLSQAF